MNTTQSTLLEIVFYITHFSCFFLYYFPMFVSSMQLICKSSHFRKPLLFDLSILLSSISLIWIFYLFIYFYFFVGSSHSSFNSLRFHFCLGVFLVSRNANPRLCLFILSGLHTFSCLKSIFMVIKHFLKVFNWNHVIGFKRRFSYPIMGVKGRFLYPINFFSGMLIWILGDMWIFDFWVFDILLKSGCLLIWMWDILLLNPHSFVFFLG